jgi:hypothetical protein
MGRGAAKIDIDDFDLSVVRSSAMDEEIHANSIKNIVFLFKKMRASQVELRNVLWDLAFENRDEFVNIRKQNPKAWRGMVEEMAFFALKEAKGGEKFPDWMTEAVLQSRLQLNLTKLVHEIREPRATGPRRKGRQIQHLKKETSSATTLCGIETKNSYNKGITRILDYTTGRTNEALRCDKCIAEVRKQKGEEFASHRKLISQRGTFLQGKVIAKTSEDLTAKTEALLLDGIWETKEQMQEEVESLFWPTILEHLLSDETGDFLSLPPASQLKRLTMVLANNLRSGNSGMRLFQRLLEEKYGPLEEGRFPWPRPDELREALAERLTIIYDPANQDDDFEDLDYEEKEERRRYKRFYSKEEQFVGEILFTLFPQEVEDALIRVQGVSLNDDIFNLWREKFPALSHDSDFDDEELV